MRGWLAGPWLLAAAAWAAPVDFVTVPAGRYRPFYRIAAEQKNSPVQVAAFQIGRYLVTNADYQEFVQARPEWRRSRIKSLYAEKGYLQHWSGDLRIDPAIRNSPVVNVSWFAARAYCRWRGGRLPGLDEWEYLAQASETRPEGLQQADFRQKVLAWYGRPTPRQLPPVGRGFRNVYGVYDIYGSVWEWVDDFNTLLGTGESRGDSGLERELYCASGSVGGLSPEDYPTYMRFAFRSSLRARYAVPNLGFRVAR
ncbi:MAG: formylglycine-generating enzyme family protein [Candidatus Eremiobacteraeota bacterium]|nr:formylglycine-generating enzyme family protein [Candidatus Eremiobacteraeota bacterium]MCW5869874.1 formylglycine-generating enzyme family protein [Candidatus Eremiobacteraeota bacterium]